VNKSHSINEANARYRRTIDLPASRRSICSPPCLLRCSSPLCFRRRCSAYRGSGDKGVQPYQCEKPPVPGSADFVDHAAHSTATVILSLVSPRPPRQLVLQRPRPGSGRTMAEGTALSHPLCTFAHPSLKVWTGSKIPLDRPYLRYTVSIHHIPGGSWNVSSGALRGDNSVSKPRL
jgi:hypothetical protein